MYRVLSFIFAAVLVPGLAAAGEYHIISREVDGTFSASHRLYTRHVDNLYPVVLCGQNYWTRARTVAWLQWEAEQGRLVGVEYNNGKGWYQLCDSLQERLTLADSGIKGDYAKLRLMEDGELEYRDRFSRIVRAFGRERTPPGGYAESYHLK